MKKSSLIIAFCLCIVALNAQTMSEKDFPIVQKIMTENLKYQTIVSQFKQVKHIPMFGDDVVSSGDFYYRKPEELALKFTDPAGDLMLLNGDKFVMVASGKRRETTATSNQLMGGMKLILSACLQGNAVQMGAKKIVVEETATQYILTADLDQATNKSGFKQVVASYDKADYSLSVLKTIEKDGSFTTYELKGKKINQPIDDSLFNTKK
ncbi:outer membrane lipoprotein carrier protein LolA [Parabacteroides sp. OttesenSCG-928-N08]|nr:outer membrane lipoprotein carrier protein LolA [Parabacteroides sp. OttesenSCG-928-N08]